MRFREIKHLIETEQLNELNMSPSALERFAKSEAAQGIQAGFEAELIFRGLANEDGGGPDLDQDTTIDTIDELRSFFEESNSRSQVSRLVGAIEDDGWTDYYTEQQGDWVEDQLADRLDYEFDQWFDDEVEDLVSNALEEAKEYDSEEIEAILKAGLRPYKEDEWSSRETYDQMESVFEEYKADVAEKAREQFAEENTDRIRDELWDEFDDSDIDFGDYLRSAYGNRYASTIWDNYSGIVDWPYYNEGGDGEFNDTAGEELAQALKQVLGMPVISSSGYHSAKRKPGLWIIEPDSSLTPDDSSDMGAEIVSPPMPLATCLEKMEALFDWANSDGDAYANRSTGFHMGVSLPVTKGKVDFVKLALFLGDEHVLREFGRSSNSYAVAAIKKIRDHIKGGNAKVADAMKLMQRGLIELANRAVMGSKTDGFGKYTSINPKGAYIEFRSAGGEDYVEDLKKAKNTLLRYSQAMAVAADPSAERQDYYKKLYKLISPAGGNTALDLFARYSSGNISAEELKKQWAEAALAKDTTPRTSWRLYDRSTNKHVNMPGVAFNNMTRDEALQTAKKEISPGSSQQDFLQSFDEKYELRDIETNTGKWAIIDRQTGDTLEVVDAATRGDAIDSVFDKYGPTGQGTGTYYVEPAQTDTSVTAPKLSRRAELAKRIKTPKATEPSHTIPGSTLDRQQQRANQQTLGQGQGWELYQLSNDAGVMMLDFRDRAAAVEQARVWIQQHNGNVDHYGVRASTGIDQGPGPAANPAPVVGATMADQEQMVRAARAADAAATPAQQATSDNGVPMWEIYHRQSGQAVHRYADHSQTSAWSTAQQWVRDNDQYLLDPASSYSVRPLTADQPAASPVAGSTQDRQQQRVQPGQFTGAWAVINSITGEELHRFSGVGNVQADANRVASQWLRTAGLTEPVEVVPIVG